MSLPWDDEPPEPSHRVWDRGYVGAHPDMFPKVIGDCPANPVHWWEPCLVGDCHVPSTVHYGLGALCLAHALEEESRAAGRSDEDLVVE